MRVLLRAQDGELDPAVLSTLPPSVAFDLIVKMRERAVTANRAGFEQRTGKPDDFSSFQLEQYLRASKFK